MTNNKEEILMSSFRDLFNKIGWLNKDKMEQALKGSNHLKFIALKRLKNIRIPMYNI